MLCTKPLIKGPDQGKSATGTWGGYKRHQRRGEEACVECLKAARLHTERWRETATDTSKQQLRTSAQVWIIANRDRIRANQRQRWYTGNFKAQVQRWRDANPDRWKAIQREGQGRRRARLAGVVTIPFTSTQRLDRLSMWSGCWMCGGVATEVDHVIPLALGGPHCLSNLRPACRSCNASKGAKRGEFPCPT